VGHHQAVRAAREAADRLEAMNVEAYKIGSGECNNLPLLEHIAQKGKPIILSTGMNDIQSIRRSVSVIQKYDLPLILMHCTSMYPTPYERVRLGAITELLEEFGLPVGLSDHSLGIYTCLGAVALGACVLEKHFTVTRSWPGPDVPISIEPHELAELVKGSRAVFVARGGSKTILDEEKPVIDFAYASVVSIRPIRKAALLDQVLGKKATRDIPADRQLKTDDVDGFEPL